jgi:hypothetical protein
MEGERKKMFKINKYISVCLLIIGMLSSSHSLIYAQETYVLDQKVIDDWYFIGTEEASGMGKGSILYLNDIPVLCVEPNKL